MNRIRSRHLVLSRIGSWLKIRSEVEYTPSSRSRGNRISNFCVVPITGVVTTNTLCAQFKMQFEVKFNDIFVVN
jgi:hypothetical protein